MEIEIFAAGCVCTQKIASQTKRTTAIEQISHIISCISAASSCGLKVQVSDFTRRALYVSGSIGMQSFQLISRLLRAPVSRRSTPKVKSFRIKNHNIFIWAQIFKSKNLQ